MTSKANLDEFDEIELYFGEDYYITDKITIHHPTIQEILNIGEHTYFNMIYTLTCIPSDMKSILFDSGVDYEEINDFDLFCLLAPTLDIQNTIILFGPNIDFKRFKRCIDTRNDSVVFADIEKNIFIDDFLYLKMVLYLRKIHNLKSKIEHSANKATKDLLIDLDRRDRELATSKPATSNMLPIVSSLLNSSGFKYNKKELRDVHYYEFIDSAKRIQVFKQADALMQGIYSGNVDSKKINKQDLDGFRDLSKDA